MTAADVIPRLAKLDVVIAGGLHAEIKGTLDTYLRFNGRFLYRQILSHWVSLCQPSYSHIESSFSHMGVTVVDEQRGDVDKIISSLQQVFKDIATAK